MRIGHHPYRSIPGDITTQCADCEDQQSHPRHWTAPAWTPAPEWLTWLGRIFWHTPFRRWRPGALGLTVPHKCTSDCADDPTRPVIRAYDAAESARPTPSQPKGTDD